MTRAPSPTDDELPAEIIEAAMRYTRVCHQNANGCPNGQYIEDASRTALAAVILAALRASQAGVAQLQHNYDQAIAAWAHDIKAQWPRASAAERERDALREALCVAQQIAELAKEMIIEMRLTPDGLIVKEKRDKSDAHYRLCSLLWPRESRARSI